MTAGNGSPKRLPRFRRAAVLSHCVLTPRDLDTLSRVVSYRLATSEHLQALDRGSGQGLLRRLQKLFHAGYLDRLLPRHVDGGGSAPMVYAITNRGIRALQKHGRLESASRTDWNAKNHSLHDLSIRHTLLVSQVRAVVELACGARPGLRLHFWKEGRELIDRVDVALPEGYAAVPVAPDAFFALEDAKGRMNFFLEADRGTMTVTRFVRKLQAYAACFRDGRHKDKFGIRFFRVLTVTTTPARTSNLVSAAIAEGLAGLDRMFLFSSESQLSLDNPESVLSGIWTTLARQCAALVEQLPTNGTEVKK